METVTTLARVENIGKAASWWDTVELGRRPLGLRAMITLMPGSHRGTGGPLSNLTVCIQTQRTLTHGAANEDQVCDFWEWTDGWDKTAETRPHETEQESFPRASSGDMTVWMDPRLSQTDESESQRRACEWLRRPFSSHFSLLRKPRSSDLLWFLLS